MAESTDFQEKERKPVSNMKELGRSGTYVSSYEIQDDYLAQLNGKEAQDLFHKMLLSDSQIRKVVHAVSNPIRSAKWSIEPASDDTKDLEVAALIEQILFKDMPNGWTGKLDEILTFPWKGFSVFEVVHKNRFDPAIGPYTGLWNLAFRDQRTIEEWRFDGAGVLTEIRQKQDGDIPVDVYLKSENLLFFFNEQKGNDIGFPFCRMLYGNYKRKLLYKELQAIGIERGAIGVPILTLPKGVDTESEEYGSAADQLDAYTQAESANFILPDGYTLEVNQTNTFDPEKVQKAIKAENEEIAGSIVGMFLEMGIGGNSGNQAGVNVSADFFRDGIEYIANKVSEAVNHKLIENLVRLNYGDTIETLPKLVHSGISAEAGKELMEIVTGYVGAGIINADEMLEDHVRKTHNLPKKAEGEVIDNQQTSDDNNDPEPDNNPDEEVELSDKPVKTPRTLISRQGEKISLDIQDQLEFSANKYINSVMNKYKKLDESKKQEATSGVEIQGQNNLKKDLKRRFTETVRMSVDMAKTEIPSKKDIKLNTYEADLVRMTDKYGDYSEIKLNEFSNLPTHIQILIAKQADLIANDSLNEMQKRIDFAFSSIALRPVSDQVVKQAMQDEAEKFALSNQVNIKGNNVSSLMVNEGRNSFFFEPDVLEEVHSFTFMNAAPKSAICKELAGVTFPVNDAESLRYSPPLHHNCKSFLRANLKTSKGVDRLEVSTLAPSAKAKKSITL